MQDSIVPFAPFDGEAFAAAHAALQSLKAHPIVITAHKSPDGDALGAALGLYHDLKAGGWSQLAVVLPDGFPAFFDWMPAVQEVVLWEKHPEKAAAKVAEAAMIFCLDYNGLDRLGPEMAAAVGEAEGDLVMIDHHLNPSGFAKWNFSDPLCGSSAELVYRWIVASNRADEMSQDVAACLYTGVMTDTGSFRFASVTAATHEMVAALLQTGIRHADIHSAVYDSNRLDRLRLVGYALSNKLEVYPEYGCAMITLTLAELNRFHARSGDTESLVNQALSVEGVNCAVFVREAKEGRVKLSLRSRGNFSVRDVAEAHFRGGGHRNASGGALDGVTAGEVADLWRSLMPKYGPQILAAC